VESAGVAERAIFLLRHAGLDPAIHVFGAARFQDVDARHKAGHDAIKCHRHRFAAKESLECRGLSEQASRQNALIHHQKLKHL
jgi:hypothetical protein